MQTHALPCSHPPLHRQVRRLRPVTPPVIRPWRRLRVRAAGEDDSAVAKKERKASPLERGGTLSGAQAAGKDAGAVALSKAKGGRSGGTFLQIVDGEFTDDRWVDGRWDFRQFADNEGRVDWDAVIDAEIARRKLLEDSPIASINDAVKFDTSEIPWWAWVRRFHLPVAEKVNGRAAMLGYFFALVVDNFTGATLQDQQNSLLGKLLMFITILGVLIFQEAGDVTKYRNLIDEAFFYDRQWSASWEGKTRPSETED